MFELCFILLLAKTRFQIKKTLTELYVEKYAARHHMLHMYGTGTHVQVRTS